MIRNSSIANNAKYISISFLGTFFCNFAIFTIGDLFFLFTAFFILYIVRSGSLNEKNIIFYIRSNCIIILKKNIEGNIFLEV